MLLIILRRHKESYETFYENLNNTDNLLLLNLEKKEIEIYKYVL